MSMTQPPVLNLLRGACLKGKGFLSLWVVLLGSFGFGGLSLVMYLILSPGERMESSLMESSIHPSLSW